MCRKVIFYLKIINNYILFYIFVTGRSSTLSLSPEQIFGIKSVKEHSKAYIPGVNTFVTPTHRPVPVIDPSIKPTRPLITGMGKPGTQASWIKYIRNYLQRDGNGGNSITASRTAPWLYTLTKKQQHIVPAPGINPTVNDTQSWLEIFRYFQPESGNSGRKDLDNRTLSWIYRLMKDFQWENLLHNEKYIHNGSHPSIYTLLKQMQNEILVNKSWNYTLSEPTDLMYRLMRNLQRGNTQHSSVSMDNQTDYWIRELTKIQQNGNLIHKSKNMTEKSQPWRLLIKNAQLSPNVNEQKRNLEIQQWLHKLLYNNTKASHQSKANTYDLQVLMSTIQKFLNSPKSASLVLSDFPESIRSYVPKDPIQRQLWIENLMKGLQSFIVLTHQSVPQNGQIKPEMQLIGKEKNLNDNLIRVFYSLILGQNGQKLSSRNSAGTSWVDSSVSTHQMQSTNSIGKFFFVFFSATTVHQ